MKMKYQMSNRERVLLSVSTALVVASVYVTYVVWPLGSRYLELRGSLAQVRERYETARQPASTATALQGEIRRWKAKGIRLTKTSQSAGAVGAAGDLVRLARGAGCDVDGVRPLEAADHDGLLAIPISFQVRGSSKSLSSLISAVEAAVPPMVLAKLKLTSKAGASTLAGEVDCYTGEGGRADGPSTPSVGAK